MSSGCLVTLALAAALTAVPARADPADELELLRQEAARLRQSVEDFDARIRALEGRSQPAPAAAGVDRAQPPLVESPILVLQRNWSEIQPGMPQERVSALLGKPARVLNMNGDLAWYYVYPGLGRGSVFFNDAGKVSSAQAPQRGW